MTRRRIIDRTGADRAIQSAASSLEDLATFAYHGEDFALCEFLQKVRSMLLGDMELTEAERDDLAAAAKRLYGAPEDEIPAVPF